MPCYSPRKGWSSAITNPSGKRSVVFDKAKGLPTHPVTIPCGQCIGCRLDRARQWSIRLMDEKRNHELSTFITLTYDDENLPKDNSLQLRDTQLFLKRLRKQHQGEIKFYLSGEYGETTFRPHYHAILFGVDFSDKKTHTKNEQGDQLYVSEKLNQLWGKGHCLTGSVTAQSCDYTARYIMKKINGEQANEHYQGRKPEFATMSKGIGKSTYTNHSKSIYTRDFVTVKGKQAPVPKYYDRLLEKDNPELLKDLKKNELNKLKPVVKTTRQNAWLYGKK